MKSFSLLPLALALHWLAFALPSAQALAPPVLPVVFSQAESGIRQLTIMIPSQGKTIETFKEGASRPFKKEIFAEDGGLIGEFHWTDNGTLLCKFEMEKNMSKVWHEFDPKSGKLSKVKRIFSDGKEVETNYRPDGETVWLKKELASAGASPVYSYRARNGMSLLRSFEEGRMIVEVFDSHDVYQYMQVWLKKDAGYRLHEVTIGNGRSRRIVHLKDDGKIEKVEYQVSGFVGWSTLKTEAGDALSEPVEDGYLKELNASDDPSVPK